MLPSALAALPSIVLYAASKLAASRQPCSDTQWPQAERPFGVWGMGNPYVVVPVQCTAALAQILYASYLHDLRKRNLCYPHTRQTTYFAKASRSTERYCLLPHSELAVNLQ